MINRILKQLLFFFLLTISAFALPQENLPPGDWGRYQDGNFIIYAEPQDEAAAQSLLKLYNRKVEEFSENLNIPIPSDIRIFIAPTKARFKFLTRGMPDWTGGLAYTKQKTIILQTPKHYPNRGQFDVTALHEAVHILISHEKQARLPKWMNEGLAMYLSGETMYKNRIPLARAVVMKKTFTLDEIDNVLQLGPENAKVAYLQSIDFINFLIKRYGWETFSAILGGFQRGEEADLIFLKITGDDFFRVEATWHSDLRKRYQWWQFVQWIDIDMIIWTSAALIVIFAGGVAIYRRRKYINSGKEEFDPEYPELYYWEETHSDVIDESEEWNSEDDDEDENY
jgi:Peptidase MA superfamily